jgi:FkbM family methyltransferase
MRKSNPRPIAFVLASSNHGTMIVNRHDYRPGGNETIGVGHQILTTSSFDQTEVDFVLNCLQERRRLYGDGVVALDCGANIGVHTVEWAQLMTGWGVVLAFEAQERIFYALAGNIAINNCFNARAVWAAIGAKVGSIRVPSPNYLVPSSFGSLEIKPSDKNEFIGQKIDYSEQATLETRMLSIDAMNLPRVDFIKVDIEGMEVEALEGAMATVRRHKPQLLIERLKSDEKGLVSTLEAEGYRIFPMGLNLLAIHDSDSTHTKIVRNPATS